MLVGMSNGAAIMEHSMVWSFLKKLNELFYPAFLLLGTYSKALKAETRIFTPVFIIALFTITKTKQNKKNSMTCE